MISWVQHRMFHHGYLMAANPVRIVGPTGVMGRKHVRWMVLARVLAGFINSRRILVWSRADSRNRRFCKSGVRLNTARVIVESMRKVRRVSIIRIHLRLGPILLLIRVALFGLPVVLLIRVYLFEAPVLLLLHWSVTRGRALRRPGLLLLNMDILGGKLM